MSSISNSIVFPKNFKLAESTTPKSKKVSKRKTQKVVKFSKVTMTTPLVQLKSNNPSTRETPNKPRYILHNVGELGTVTENLSNGECKSRKVYHMGESGVLCEDLETFISWEQF